MRKIMIGLIVTVSLSFVSDCFAEGLVVVSGGGDTIWARTCQTCAWTQVPGNLKTAAVVWDAGLERYVLYGTNAGGQIYSCTFDRGGNFQNDWVLVPGYAQSKGSALDTRHLLPSRNWNWELELGSTLEL
jgi:hypothetical protein